MSTPPLPLSRREALKRLGAVGAGWMLGGGQIIPFGAGLTIAGRPVEIAVASLSPSTVRLTVRPLEAGKAVALPATGELARPGAGKVLARGRDEMEVARVLAGDLVVRVTDGPPTLQVERADGTLVQRLGFDATESGMSFLLGSGPLLGLGEGGPQFDRRGSVDRMVNGEAVHDLGTHGARVPVQWMVGTEGWAMFIHQPTGTFDFTGGEGRFSPHPDGTGAYDVFVVASDEPAEIMGEYARITGLPEMPPRWSFGYLQSHRSLAGPEEIASEARTFREKRLPCDALIYLGTGFAPTGWNTANGEFTWNPEIFPHPRDQLAELHAEHFRVVVHVVVEGHRLLGTVSDPCTGPRLPSGRTPDGHWPPERQVACYWPHHRGVMEDGVDGWWPDQGDGFDDPSEINRHRMYWEGTQLYRPGERPFALHRNAAAGVQRYGGLLWSGDVLSKWETLKTHVPVALNTGLSGLPYWGSDIGGFVPTEELTGELYLRWFQFAAFCPVFRSHGRNWHLRLPWGWDGGDGGPPETRGFHIDPAKLHDSRVEPICRKYLELRYRLMPYLYTAVRESHDTGMPIMRALWLHYPDDPRAVARDDEYLWGRDLLVAPVVEKAATTRRLYLPHGTWVDFWTGEQVAGGREIERAVELATVPLYVRAGAVVPMGPVRQYTDEPSDQPMTLVVHPGADGESSWYDDDGHTFGYRDGDWTRLQMTWRDAERRLTLRLDPQSRPLSPSARRMEVRVAGSTRAVPVELTGREVELTIPAPTA